MHGASGSGGSDEGDGAACGEETGGGMVRGGESMLERVLGGRGCGGGDGRELGGMAVMGRVMVLQMVFGV